MRFFLKDADVFFQRYPLLTTDSSSAWRNFRSSISEIIKYGLAKRPFFFRLAILFSVLICSGAASVGGLISFNQAQALQNQAVQYTQVLAAQTADGLQAPLLLNNQPEMASLVAKLLKENTIAGVAVYANDHSVIKSYGTNLSTIFPLQEIEYRQAAQVSAEIINKMQGKVRQIKRYTVPIKDHDLKLGYLSLSFDYAELEAIRIETLQILIAVTLATLVIAMMLAFYISGLFFQPLNDLLTASEIAHKINLGENKHDPKSQFARKDELQVLMESMNKMHGGLVQKDQVEAFFSRYVASQGASPALKDLDAIENVKLGGEHVMASVFFADIVGFTSLSETMNPQELSELLNEYFSKVIEVVNFCHGHVDKFIGDCAMVLFGVPEKDQQHAFNCVACGWMILQLVEQFNDKREAEGAVTVEFRVGANSGMMLAGNMGSAERMEYTVVGDSVNLASRLSGTGEPGELIITEDVFIEQGLEGSVLTEVKDLIKLRGKKLPVKILNVKDILSPFKQQMLDKIPLIIAGNSKK